MSAVAESLVDLLIVLLTERACLSDVATLPSSVVSEHCISRQDEKGLLRRQLLHRLVVKACSHSELEKYVLPRRLESKEADAVLSYARLRF